MPSVGGLSQSCLFRKHPHWRWTAASVGDRIKCPDSAIRCGCRASCRIHAIFFIVFSCSELGTEKRGKRRRYIPAERAEFPLGRAPLGGIFGARQRPRLTATRAAVQRRILHPFSFISASFFWGQKFPSGSMLLRPFIGPIEAAPCH